jgi:hypothetical protein
MKLSNIKIDGAKDSGVTVCMYVCMHVYTYMHTVTHTYIHTYIHTHAYTHTYLIQNDELCTAMCSTTSPQAHVVWPFRRNTKWWALHSYVYLKHTCIRTYIHTYKRYYKILSFSVAYMCTYIRTYIHAGSTKNAICSKVSLIHAYVRTCIRIYGHTQGVIQNDELSVARFPLFKTQWRGAGVAIPVFGKIRVCMYVCMYVWICVFIYVCMYVCMR